MKIQSRLGALLCAFIFATKLSIFGQGSLTPPAAPTPTMKTLDQVEARTPIDATHTPGDGSNQYIINAAGSYYLTGLMVGISSKNGISVNADDVTIDLNGFAVISVSGLGEGITMPAAHRNLRIYNGSVRGWGGAGINCSNASNSQFDHLRLSQNFAGGLRCGSGNVLSEISAESNTGGEAIVTGIRCILSNCSASNNTGPAGIATDASCRLSNCSAANNSVTDGIATGNACTLTHCTAVSNTSGASTSSGISTGTQSAVIACTVAGTDNSNPTGTSSTGIGIRTSSKCTIIDCTVTSNKGDGILFTANCLVRNNTCQANGVGNGGSGIHTQFNKSRIEGNTSIDNETGYTVESGGNLIIKNSSRGGLAAFTLAPGNSVGDRIDVFNGGAGANITSTNSWANFLY